MEATDRFVRASKIELQILKAEVDIEATDQLLETLNIRRSLRETGEMTSDEEDEEEKVIREVRNSLSFSEKEGESQSQE